MASEEVEGADKVDHGAEADARSLRRTRHLFGITAVSLAVTIPLTITHLELDRHNKQNLGVEQTTPAPSETETLNDMLDGQLDRLVVEPMLQNLHSDPNSPSRVTLKVHAKQNVGARAKLASYEDGGNVKVKTRLVARPFSLGGTGLMPMASSVKWVQLEAGALPDKSEDQLSGTAAWNVDPTKVPPSELVAIAHESTLKQIDGDTTSTRTTDVVDGVVRVSLNKKGEVTGVIPVSNDKIQPGDIFSTSASDEELSRV
jgi:hypothetical protein